MVTISVHTVVSSNSIKYFKYLVENYTKKKSSEAKLIFYAHCTDNSSAKYFVNNSKIRVISAFSEYKNYPSQSLREFIKKWIAFFGKNLRLSGSGGHIVGLNSILKNLDQENINIIADADTVMLLKNWDLKIIELLVDYGVVGTPYEDIGGFSSGSSIYQTYKDKPNAVWMALSPKYPWSKLSFNHIKNKNLLINNEYLSELYNLPVGYELVRDVGWEIPLFLEVNNIQYRAFKQIKPTSPKIKVLKTGIDYHEEYHLDDSVVLAHQRGSNIHPFRGNEISRTFYDACESH